MSDAHAIAKGRNRTILWLLFAVCAAPVIASYVSYYWWQPAGRVNYGELLAPRPLPDTPLSLIDGTPFRLSQLRGKWIFVTVDRAACDAYCVEKLTYLRQLRLAQGADSDRIERVWILTDDGVPDRNVMARYAGTYAVRGAGSAVLAALQATGTPGEHLYIVDPLGNLMMRSPRDPDPQGMLKDVARLLRHSKWAA